MAKKPNLLFIGIDSLRRDHMSHYGYGRLTTPHISEYAKGGVTFNQCFSPSVPTTSGYSSMMTGRDLFGTNVVALRHEGTIAEGVPTLAEMLRQNGYTTTCVGFEGNPGGRGYDKYINFSGWGADHADGRAHKADNLNEVTLPEMERLAKQDQPFMLFLRHMDPHSPYLPPEPFQGMFYEADAFDPNDHSLDPVYAFKPFCDYFYSWFPPYCKSADYIISQYDGAVAYMDACIQKILEKLKALGLEEDTIVIFTSDHGETLYDHDCYFDHHGLYDCTLVVPLILRWKGHLPENMRLDDYCQLKDVTPTLLDLMGIQAPEGVTFDGRSLMPLTRGEEREREPEFYITECTWMRKHGWRTPEWKLIRALEPDFHFKPAVELYNLVKDPAEYDNLAEKEPGVVAMLTERMEQHIAKREAAVGRENPIYNNLNWHGYGCGPFKTSEQAYNTLHIGDPEAARKLQQHTEDKK